MPPPGPVSPTTHDPPVTHVNAIVVVVVVVVVVEVVVVVVVVVGGTIVVVDEHGSVDEGMTTKPPSNTNGATTTDKRPAEVCTQRVTITPAINMNRPKITTRVDPPVSGSSHTSTGNISHRPPSSQRQNSDQSNPRQNFTQFRKL
jgi:hypothetical protein